MAGIVAVVGLLCAVLVALTSSNDKPPIYHCVSVCVGVCIYQYAVF